MVVLPGPVDSRIEGFDGFQVVIEDIRCGLENGFESLWISPEIRDQNFDSRPRTFGPDLADRLGEERGPSVPQIVACHRSDDSVIQVESDHGLGDVMGVIPLGRKRIAFSYGTKSAVSRARVPEEKKSGGFFLPAFPDIGTPGTLTDRVETVSFQNARHAEKTAIGRQTDFEPIGLFCRQDDRS